jgi:CHASE1-domain containing sensor protein
LLITSSVIEPHAYRVSDDHRCACSAVVLKNPRRGLSSIDWNPRVRDQDRETFEKQTQAEGIPGFRIRDQKKLGEMVPSPQRPEYYPVQYQVPIATEGIALGFDLGSNPTRLEALKRARDSGEKVATGRIVLVEETDPSLYSLLVYQPVYRPGVAVDSVRARRDHLIGFAVEVIRVRDVLEDSLRGFPPIDLDITLYDSSAAENEQLLHYHPRSGQSSTGRTSPPTPQRDTLARTEEILVGRRTWAFVVESTPEFLATRQTWVPWLAAVAILIGTWLFCAYLHAQRTKKQEVDLLVTARTNQLSIANASLEESQIRLRRQVATLGQLTFGDLLTEEDLIRQLERITELVARTLRVERVSVWRFTPDRASIRCLTLFSLRTGKHTVGMGCTTWFVIKRRRGGKGAVRWRSAGVAGRSRRAAGRR